MQLSIIFGKSKTTISNWIEKFENTGTTDRKKAIEAAHRKFSAERRRWLVDLYIRKPILHRNEASRCFFAKFGQKISTATISTILHEADMTWQKLERRAMQISEADILRFTEEMLLIPWLPQMLVFLDEVGFDNTDMVRKNGYGLKGKRLLYRGEFCRKARSSLLCFLGCNGILDTFLTEGTFTRLKFVECAKEFATGVNSKVQQYPGSNSIWIMDGARIHCDEDLVTYFRSLGIIIIFLPAYCPFYNPIELVFGWLKQKFRLVYNENTNADLNLVIGEVMNQFTNASMANIFHKCGYCDGKFDPSKGLGQKIENLGFELN